MLTLITSKVCILAKLAGKPFVNKTVSLHNTQHCDRVYIWGCCLDRQTSVIMSVWDILMAMRSLASGNSCLNIGKSVKTKYWHTASGSYD